MPTNVGVDATASTVSFVSGSSLNINISGTTVDSDYTQLNVSGGVNLSGVKLLLTGSFTSALGDAFTIVSATSITGTFNGLANNALTTFNGRSFQITYMSTSVTLTDGGVPNITLTNAFPANSSNQPITPVIGQQTFIQVDFTTQNLPTNASYRATFSVDGAILYTSFLDWGAGNSGTGYWDLYWGSWTVAPGTHTVTVKLDPDHSVAETTYTDNATTFTFTSVEATTGPAVLTESGIVGGYSFAGNQGQAPANASFNNTSVTPAPVNATESGAATDPTSGATAAYAVAIQANVNPPDEYGNQSGEVQMSAVLNLHSVYYTNINGVIVAGEVNGGYSNGWNLAFTANQTGTFVGNYDVATVSDQTGSSSDVFTIEYSKYDNGQYYYYVVTSTDGNGVFSIPLIAGDSYTIKAFDGYSAFGFPYFDVSDSMSLSWQLMPTSMTTLNPSLNTDQRNGGLDVGYAVSGAAIPQATTVNLYWATGNQFTDVIGRPIPNVGLNIPAGTVDGIYDQSNNIPAGNLGTPPSGATYLLAVADPNNVLGDFTEAQNVVALALPDVTDTFNSTSAGIIYPGEQLNTAITVTDQNAINSTGNIDIAYYLSQDQNPYPDSNDILLSTQPVTLSFPTNPGSNGDSFQVTDTLTIMAGDSNTVFPPGTYYLKAVLESGDVLLESNTADDAAVSNPLAYYYTPAQISQAYGVNLIQFGSTGASVAGNGAGQTIAIIDPGNDASVGSDLTMFDTDFNLPAPPSAIQVVNETGGATLPTSIANVSETSADVEWAHAMAPGANIVLIEMQNVLYSDVVNAVMTARNLGVSVVSMSFSYPEFPGETSTSTTAFDNGLFTAPGITYVASSGDNGQPPRWPAASPNVIAVGAANLFLNADGSWANETGWSNPPVVGGNAGGSGGGFSADETEPGYQSNAYAANPGYYGLLNPQTTNNARATPDVSFNGGSTTPVSIVAGGTVGPFSGTSLSAPCWAGLMAIADQGLDNAGQPVLTSATALAGLYSLPSTDFHDVTTGYNGSSAGPGYDLVSGIGTPIANLLVPALVNYRGITPVGSVTLPTPILQNIATGSVLLATFTQGTATQAATSYSASVAWGDGATDTTAETNSPLSIVVTGQNIYVIGTHAFTTSGTLTVGIALNGPGGASATAYSTADVASDATGQASVSRSGLVYNRSTRLFNGSLTLANPSSTNTGSVDVLLQGLTGGVTLTYASITVGTQTYVLAITLDSAGDPYIHIPQAVLAALSPGQSFTISLRFSDPSLALFSFNPDVFTDPFDN